MIHHIATIFLIGFSYCANFVRVGTFVMLVHDSSDFLLEVKTLGNPFKPKRLTGFDKGFSVVLLSLWLYMTQSGG